MSSAEPHCEGSSCQPQIFLEYSSNLFQGPQLFEAFLPRLPLVPLLWRWEENLGGCLQFPGQSC